jgi:hypothetical protein
MAIVKLGKEEIDLNPKYLEFTQDTINEFLSQFAARYNYYCEKYADAQYIHSKYEDRYDVTYGHKFKSFKESDGGSDKLADAATRSDSDVAEAAERVIAARHAKDLIWGYLRSMDRAHEDAMQTCYNMRKEMDKMNSSVKKLDEMFGG